MQDVEDIYALSPMQHGMLFDSVTVEDSGLYLIQLEYFLRGPLDAESFRAAWQATLASHAILRTSFHWDDLEKPLQVVHKAVELPFAREDLSALAPDEQAARRASLRASERERGIDFGAPPLMRLTLAKTGPHEHCLLWSFHHVLMEGWSASMVLEEVLARYRARREGTPLELAERRPYRDYVAWLLERDPNEAEAYWRRELAGYRMPTHLPIDRSPTVMHAPVRSYDGRKIELSADATSALNAFARRHDLTLNTIVQGAWALLLARTTGDPVVGFGTIVSGRSVPLEGVDGMVGLFVNLLPTRIAVPSSATIAEWLRGLQARQARQREFEYASLASIKSWSEVPAGLPLFESILVFENWHGDLARTEWADGLVVEDVEGHHGGPGYPIAAVVVPAPELVFGISYDTERFDGDAIDRLLGHVRHLLESLPRHADRPVAELGLVDADELARLARLARPRTETFELEPVHRSFERRAAETPDAVAVALHDGSLTYAELNARADRLAHGLRALGAHAEGGRVGLCSAREPEMIVALVGILKAGCAYVPIDPAYPAERKRLILEDSGARFLVTSAALLESLHPQLDGLDVRPLTLDEAVAATDDARSGPLHDVPLEAVAYVIYTSGSTGRPKGVLVPHRALASYTAHARREFELEPADRVLQFASISFDTAGEEIWPTLASGACSVLRDDEMLASVADFLAALERERVSIVDFPTAYWHAVVDGLADAERPFPACVRLAILGGERAKPEQLARWFESVGDRTRLLNTYGPTEATIVATSCELRADDPGARSAPIGRAITNASAWVIDAAGRPCPAGVPGELAIGGAGVAHGYLDRPALTAERFVPDPFPDAAPGSRLYRTGDVVRYRADSQLEFLGRRDDQVKFRGYRIELGEIEAALAEFEDVREAVCGLRASGSEGLERLVAWIVPARNHGGAPPDPAELKRALEGRLPAYMVPSVTVVVDALPLSPHGKVDRDALPDPAPAAATATRGSRHVEPETELEKQLAAIWEDVLELESIGLNDSFFDLGGHSLLLMRVVARIKKELGIKLRPGELVLPTLGQLARLCAERQREPAGKPRGFVRRLFGAVRGRRSS